VRRSLCEALEPRRLLSAIVWSNRGSTANDTDGFNRVFGGLANQARAVIDADLAAWQRVIASFNYGNGTDTYTVAVNMNAAALTTPGNGVGANASFTNSINGKPSQGAVGIGWRNIAASGNSSNGWYLDPTPTDSSEFQGTRSNGYVQGPTAALGGGDLFSGVLHELGHAFGLSSNASINAFATDTGATDVINAPAASPAAHYWRLDTPNSHTLWTGYDSGGATGGATGQAGAQHFAPAGAVVDQNGRKYYGQTGLMNAFFSSRSLINDDLAFILQDVYGYTIARPSQFGTFYDTLDANGTLRIDAPTGNVNNNLDLQVNGGNLFATLSLGAGQVLGIDAPSVVSIFPLANVKSIRIDMGDGTDAVTIAPLAGTIPITLDGNGGNDSLTINGSGGDDNFVVNGGVVTGTGVNVTSAQGMESLVINTGLGDANVDLGALFNFSAAIEVNASGGNETLRISRVGAYAGTINISGNGGADTIYVGTNATTNAVNARLTVNGNEGNDAIYLAPTDFFLSTGVINRPVTVNGGNDNDRVILTAGLLAAISSLVTFDGGPNTGGFGDEVVLNDGSDFGDSTYNIYPASIAKNAASVINFAGAETLTLNGGAGANAFVVASFVTQRVQAYGYGGNDNFVVGGGVISTTSNNTFDGGGGVDTITFNDSQSATARIWDVHPDEIFFGGLIPLATAGFESVAIYGGINGDEFDFYGEIRQNLYVDGGYGANNFIWRAANNFYYYADGGAQVQYAATLVGGIIGGNSLNVLDSTRVQADYYLTPGIFSNTEPGGVGYEGATFNYSGFANVAITAGADDDTFTVVGTPADIINQTTLLLGGGSDTVRVYPRKADGARSLLSPLGIGGGAGTDAVTVDDSGSATPATWTVNNLFGPGTQNVSVAGSPLGMAGDVEANALVGSQADDVFNVNQYTSGTRLIVYGQAGNDTTNVGNGSVVANLTGIAGLFFDGQGGAADAFNLNDSAATVGATFRRYLGTLSVTGSGGYTVAMTDANLETVSMAAGGGSDVFRISGVAAATALNLAGGAGLDVLLIGDGVVVTDPVRGPINFDAGPDAGRVQVVDTAANVGKTLHLDATSLGAYAGDTLFGPGGSLQFTPLVDQVISGLTFAAMSILLGSGGDTVYAQPFATGQVNVEGRGPTASPGDRLFLALAAAQNYGITTTFGGNGTVTSSNLKTLSWYTFESAPTVDAVAPAVAQQDFAFNGAKPAVAIRFNEDVGASLAKALAAGAFNLVNVAAAAGAVGAAPGAAGLPGIAYALSYDPATLTASLTFPSYPNGALPDGNYRLTTNAGYADTSGNAGVPASFDFFVLAGDANHDRVVNFSDLLALAKNYNQTGRTFAQGDFNYDGTVNFNDLLALARKYNTSLPAPAEPVATPSPLTATAVIAPVLRDTTVDQPVSSTTRAAPRAAAAAPRPKPAKRARP
jgi:hypothetical protein